MRKLWIGIIIVAIIVFVVVSVVIHIKHEPKEISIGVIAPLTGGAAAAGEMVKRGVDLAVEEINTNNGVRGKKLVALYEDSKGTPNDGVSAMRKLVSQYHVPAVIGGVFSSVTLAIGPIAEKTKTVVLSPASSNPQISDAGDYVFRVWPSDNFEGDRMAYFVIEKLKLNRVAVIHSTDDYGVGIAEVFLKEFRVLGGNAVIVETYHEKDTDFRTQLTKIRGTKPEAVYLIGHYGEMAQILKQAKELGVNAQFLSVSAFEVPELLQLAGDAAEGVIYFTPTYDTTSKERTARDFVMNFRKKYGKEPGIVEAHAYDAVNILAYAMKKNGLSSTQVKDALYKIRNYSGVTGRITFDPRGDVIKPLMIKTVKNQKFAEYPN